MVESYVLIRRFRLKANYRYIERRQLMNEHGESPSSWSTSPGCVTKIVICLLINLLTFLTGDRRNARSDKIHCVPTPRTAIEHYQKPDILSMHIKCFTNSKSFGNISNFTIFHFYRYFRTIMKNAHYVLYFLKVYCLGRFGYE